ncbi:MAG: thiamine phosphate synthase [Magnetococcus sp. DMHC-8]
MKVAGAVRGVLPILDADWLDHLTVQSTTGGVPAPVDRDALVDAIAHCLGRSSVTWVQLRCKGAVARCAPFAALWMAALRRHGPHLVVVINDHVELAVSLAADGVHVGQTDTPVAVCRQRLGPDKLIGLSTHSLAEVEDANRADVDYVGFGPLFATCTKPDAAAVQGVTRLAAVCRTARKPVVAIGGIQVADLAQVATAGATAAAMISGLWAAGQWQQRLAQAEQAWEQGSRRPPRLGHVRQEEV